MNIDSSNHAPMIYTVEDIMDILRISRNVAYKLFNSDGFPALRINRLLRVEKTAFENWLKSNEGRTFLI